MTSYPVFRVSSTLNIYYDNPWSKRPPRNEPVRLAMQRYARTLDDIQWLKQSPIHTDVSSGSIQQNASEPQRYVSIHASCQ